MVVEFTVQERPEKQFILASAVHLLCFSPPTVLFGCLCTTVATLTVAEQEAEAVIPLVVKHCFPESLGICKPHEQNVFMFSNRFLCPGWLFIILDATRALTGTMILQKRLAQGCCLSNTTKGSSGVVWIPWHLNWNMTWKIWTVCSEIWHKNARNKTVYFHAGITLPQVGSCY